MHAESPHGPEVTRDMVTERVTGHFNHCQAELGIQESVAH